MIDSILMDYNVICVGQEKEIDAFFGFHVIDRLYPEFSFLEYIKGIKYQYIFDYDERICLTKESYRNFYCERAKEQNFIEDSLIFFLKESPIHKVIVLFRLQLDEKETIIGEINLSQFLKKLKEGKLRPNVAYLVKL